MKRLWHRFSEAILSVFGELYELHAERPQSPPYVPVVRHPDFRNSCNTALRELSILDVRRGEIIVLSEGMEYIPIETPPESPA